MNGFKTPDYFSYQSESVSLLIEEDDVPPGNLFFKIIYANK